MRTQASVAGRLILTLAMCLLAFSPGAHAAPGDGIGGVEVGIRKNPGGQLIKTIKMTSGSGFKLPALNPGSYTITMSFRDPLLALPPGSAGKSFYESRSNTARIAMRGPILNGLTFDKFPYVYLLKGENVTRAGEAIVRKGDLVEIQLAIEIGGAVATTIQGDLRRTWTNWFDRDDPSGVGDYELYKDLVDGKTMCAAPLGIECTTVNGEKDWGETKQVYHCDLAMGGYCVNREQVSGGSCVDYKVRYLCPLVE